MKKITVITCFLLLVTGVLFNLNIPLVQAASVVSVAVCQAGYSTDQIKTAVVVVTSGSLSDTSYQIIKTSDGSQAYSGTMTVHTPTGWTRGETYYKIDFSSFNQTGDFKLKTNGILSLQFTIAGNIWTNYTDEMVEFYRIQRCGTDTNSVLPSGFTNRPSAEALHGLCHRDDAGDNNKYQGNTGWVTGAIAVTFLRHTNATFDYDANGVPDLLDEARWGAENLLKIQSAAGGFGIDDVIDAPNGQQYAWKYPSLETNGAWGDSDDRIAHTRGTNSAPNAMMKCYTGKK